MSQPRKLLFLAGGTSAQSVTATHSLPVIPVHVTSPNPGMTLAQDVEAFYLEARKLKKPDRPWWRFWFAYEPCSWHHVNLRFTYREYRTTEYTTITEIRDRRLNLLWQRVDILTLPGLTADVQQFHTASIADRDQRGEAINAQSFCIEPLLLVVTSHNGPRSFESFSLSEKVTRAGDPRVLLSRTSVGGMYEEQNNDDGVYIISD